MFWPRRELDHTLMVCCLCICNILHQLQMIMANECLNSWMPVQIYSSHFHASQYVWHTDLVTLFSKNPVGLGINIHLKVQLNVKCSGWYMYWQLHTPCPWSWLHPRIWWSNLHPVDDVGNSLQVLHFFRDKFSCSFDENTEFILSFVLSFMGSVVF